MQAKDETPKMEAILEVYRDLGLEDAKERDRFRQWAKPSELDIWHKKRCEPQDARNNTAKEGKDSHA